VGCAAPPKPAARPTQLPAAELQSLTAEKQALAEALNGRPALLSLWATWCDACQKEMPDLEALDREAKQRGAVVMGVAVGESVATVKSFATAHRMSYAILVDEEFHLADALGEKRVPATIVIDRTGKIVYTGGKLDSESRAAFEKLF
jgi:peroxiredoxin